MAPKSKKKKNQTRLTFEPVASSSSPNPGISTAKVRFSGAATSSPSRPPVVDLDDSDDDAPIVASSSSRPSRPAFIKLDDSDDSDVVSPTKRRKMSHAPSSSAKSQKNDDASDTDSIQPITPGRLKRPNQTASSPTKQSRHKGHRSEKQKKMELLRRRRAGEKIDKLTSSESSDDDKEPRGLFDTDSENEFEVLKQFDDDEEPEEAEKVSAQKKSARKKRKEKEANDNSDDDLDDFVTDDDDAPIGAPAYLDIPLEFTSQAHKPLKDQFPYAVEWLVHNRINPAFERKDAVYSNAWRKLDDEVHGLASSKFTSSAWKPEFYRALKGRPGMETYELPPGSTERISNTCEACGRSGHPASWRVVFEGQPYYKDTLAEVESDSDSHTDDGDDAASVDTQGMELPPTTKEWYVGAVCCSNAETAHRLIHWKHALKSWVEERLEDEGWMAAGRLRERERMKARRRARLANAIVDGWRDQGTVAALYGDFKKNLEEARNKATTGRGLRGRFR
ncbi:hypothetical protein F5X99DRAFT_372886 [Biscogniauxia marginata]|nr:hypothetical protein F5X99DRAFT_372886 [Biscogniauxia marginata]